MKVLHSAARYLVGALFIFSGLIKVNDPVGTQIKLEEYFTVFSVDIAPIFDALKPYSLFLSVFLSTLEVVLGVALLMRLKEKWTTSLLLVIIVFFTFLTFYSAYFNKVTDCGCFGDAIKLTPWQSFIKDIILLALILILFVGRKKNERERTLKIQIGAVAVSLGFCLVVCFLSVAHLPAIDFRAYKIGTSIPDAMMPPADDPYTVPKITNYAFWGEEDDYTDRSLTGKKLLVIVHETYKTDMDSYGMINSLIGAVERDIEVTAITSSSGQEFEELRHSVQLAIPYYFSDKTLLKTMIRSNPGLVLIKNGVIKGKWHYNDVPSADEIFSNLDQ